MKLIMGAKNSALTVRTTLYIPKRLHSELKIEAVKRDSSMTQLVIDALRNELKKNTKARA